MEALTDLPDTKNEALMISDNAPEAYAFEEDALAKSLPRKISTCAEKVFMHDFLAGRWRPL